MNEVARHAPAGNVASPSQNRSLAISKMLAGIDNNYLAAFREIDRLSAAHGRWPTVRKLKEAVDEWTLDRLRHSRVGSENRRQVGAVLNECPSVEDITGLGQMIEAALQETPRDRTLLRSALSVMIDAFPNARPHSPEAYVESLVHEVLVDGYSVAAVAKAASEIRRSKTFAPAIAEVIEACKEAQASITWRRQACQESPALIRELQGRLAEAKALGDIVDPAPPGSRQTGPLHETRFDREFAAAMTATTGAEVVDVTTGGAA